jgi:hypothetical protein
LNRFILKGGLSLHAKEKKMDVFIFSNPNTFLLILKKNGIMFKSKFFMIFMAMFLFVGVATAQNAKQKEKAVAEVAELDKKLVAIDAALALSEEQKAKIQAIYEKRMVDLNEIKKAEGDEAGKKEKQKAIKKESNKEVNKTILTKEQRNALKGGKGKKEKE